MAEPIDLDELLKELDACATMDDGPFAQAARCIRALRADFERASTLARTYGRTADNNHVHLADIQWLDAARARWSSTTKGDAR